MSDIKFQQTLLKWYTRHKRPLPWREFSDPYPVWLSEIILQQTRVQQGMNYWYKFMEYYPTVLHLAKAHEDDVMKDWEGLGYYSRARNLHKGAKYIANDLDGVFPSTYKDILKIPGVGPYTAAAISSFCFGEVQAVLDGNVFRVLARLYGINTPINTGLGQREFSDLANIIIDKTQPGEYNQAIMEFGALQCVPKNPDCASCVFKEGCVAFKEGNVAMLPVKKKAKKEKDRYFNYVVFEEEGKVLLNKRNDKDIWFGMFEFPMVELPGNANEQVVVGELSETFQISAEAFTLSKVLPNHKLSHQILHINVWKVSGFLPEQSKGYERVNIADLHKYAMPRPLRKFVDDNQLPLPFGL